MVCFDALAWCRVQPSRAAANALGDRTSILDGIEKTSCSESAATITIASGRHLSGVGGVCGGVLQRERIPPKPLASSCERCNAPERGNGRRYLRRWHRFWACLVGEQDTYRQWERDMARGGAEGKGVRADLKTRAKRRSFTSKRSTGSCVANRPKAVTAEASSFPASAPASYSPRTAAETLEGAGGVIASERSFEGFPKAASSDFTRST